MPFSAASDTGCHTSHEAVGCAQNTRGIDMNIWETELHPFTTLLTIHKPSLRERIVVEPSLMACDHKFVKGNPKVLEAQPPPAVVNFLRDHPTILDHENRWILS
jgi:hypothetical protein